MYMYIAYTCIYYVAMVTTGLTPLYIHLSKIQHSIYMYITKYGST